MEYIVILLLLLAVGLAAGLWKTAGELKKAKEALDRTARQAEETNRDAAALAGLCDAVWEHANTIHLYASLSEEESASPTVREKQGEILRQSGEILRLTRRR